MIKLEAGKAVPKFKLRNQRDEFVSLADFKGAKLLIFFYPKALTSG